MKLIRKVASIFDRIEVFLAIVAGALIVVVLLFILYEVFIRYFLGWATIWTFEISRWALLYITFLGAAWVLKKEGHVKIDLLVNHLNPRIQALLGIASSIMGLFICWVLVWYGVQVTHGQFQRGIYEATALGTPTGVIILAIPIGGFLLFIQFLRRGYGYLRRWKQLGIGPKGVE